MTKYVFFFFAALAMADTAPIADENLRLGALQAIFPAMRISLNSGKRIDDSWPEVAQPRALNAPDALAGENVYRVTGNPTNEAEKQASSQLVTGKASGTRLVRFRLFPWTGRTTFMAVLQYNFEDAIPPMACPSIGLLVQLTNASGNWEVRDRYLLETTHHFSLQTVRLTSLGADGDELVIESDFGGADTWGTNLMIFHPGPKIEQVFETTSQIVYKTDEMFTQTLDLPRTIDLDGKQVCFTKTAMFENGQPLKPVVVSHVCYKLDAEVDRQASEERNKLLAPR
ncbi:MAG TPA: hypothetical protein VNU44_07550 [Bryobacteraceae bacterium]|jgi:hypothetical protein|nr:hypothetical protein [Bryobacteraceae bacterium]